jgi:hypothetical protein
MSLIESHPEILSAANPKRTPCGSIVLDVEHRDFPGEILKYAANPNDIIPLGRILFEMAENEQFGSVASAVTEIVGEAALDKIRLKRERLLEEKVDPLVSNPLRWADLGEEKQALVAAYRQALLDMTENNPNARYIWSNEHMKFVEDNITWPELNLGE